MDSVRYVGLDVHRDTISAAVLDAEGKLLMQSVLATRAAAILIGPLFSPAGMLTVKSVSVD